jgi:5-formyltetrahydrofolate cyclo-ligase
MTLTRLEAKAALRRRMRTWLRDRPPAERTQASAATVALLLARPEWQAARGVLLFAPLPDELDLWPLAEHALEQGRRLTLPRFDPAVRAYHVAEVTHLERDVRTGAFGIREPASHCPVVPLNQLDLLLVPGLCFDLAGRRLGRGKGYYDRLLGPPHGTACGVAWDQQVLPTVPAGAADQMVDCILTPTRWLAVARR